jgi:hypothetical protein
MRPAEKRAVVSRTAERQSPAFGDRECVARYRRRATPARRRIAPDGASNSVRTNIFENAGCAVSEAGVASTISAYDVSSMCLRTRDVADSDPTHLGVVFSRHDDVERGHHRRRVETVARSSVNVTSYESGSTAVG